MKKIYLLLGALAITCSSFGQAIFNADMELWRTSSSGSSPMVNTQSPNQWFSADSLAIGGAQLLASFGYWGSYTPTNLYAQLFQETTIKHGGASSAKLVTARQDTLGVVPGSLANAVTSVNTGAFTSGGSIASALTYVGGTATNLRITSVSAWVEYFPGKDSVTHVFGGVDSGMLVVQASSNGTIVGTGTAMIYTASTFTQLTANVTYTDTVDLVDTVKIIFSSSKATGALDSSIMYVDDVSMIGVAQTVHTGVTMQNMKNDVVKVYPNPATGILHLDGAQIKGFTCDLMSVSGQLVGTKTLTGSDIMDVSYLPSGLYFYNIADASGNKVQRGKVSITH